MVDTAQVADAMIRPATPSDARSLAELIEIAGGGIPGWLWSQMAEPGETPLDVGERRARREQGGFSYRHATVAEIGGAVAGMILAYRLDAVDEEEIAAAPDLVRPFLELEREVPGSFYINAFAIYEPHRGRRLGTRLVEATFGHAEQAGCSTLSVQYFSQNPRAGVFYERHGFRFVAERKLVAHPACRYDDRTVLLVRG